METKASKALSKVKTVSEAKMPKIDMEDIDNGDIQGMITLVDVMRKGMRHHTKAMSGVPKAAAKGAQTIELKMEGLAAELKHLYSMFDE